MSTRRLIPGDRVFVTDAALEAQRNIMERAGEPATDNHRGTVNTVYRDSILIDFDDGVCAPYDPHMVSLEEEA